MVELVVECRPIRNTGIWLPAILFYIKGPRKTMEKNYRFMWEESCPNMSIQRGETAMIFQSCDAVDH